MAAYTKAIDLRPRDPILWVQLSSAQGAAGDLEAAATSVLEALEIAPGFADARVQLVAILREGRHFDEALAELEPLEAMSPGHPDIAAQRAALEAARDALAEAASKPGHIRLSRIYVRDQAAADALSGKLADERPFETLARDYGEGPERLRAGDIGFMDPADLRPELADVVTTLAVGDVTPVVDLGGAWVVIKRTE